jgi:hypothetical protein
VLTSHHRRCRFTTMLAFAPSPVYYSSAGTPGWMSYADHGLALRPPAYDSALRASLVEREHLFAQVRREALGRQTYPFAHQRQQDFLGFLSCVADDECRMRIRRHREEVARRQRQQEQEAQLLALRRRRAAWLLHKRALAEAEAAAHIRVQAYERERFNERREEARRARQQMELSRIIDAFMASVDQQMVSTASDWGVSFSALICIMTQPLTTKTLVHPPVSFELSSLGSPLSNVDIKGKAKAKDQSLPSLTPLHQPLSSLEDALRQRSRSENDHEIQATLASLLNILSPGASGVDEPKNKKAVRFDEDSKVHTLPACHASNAGSLKCRAPQNAEPSDSLPQTPTNGPTTTRVPTTKLERKRALSGDAAAKVLAHRLSKASLQQIVSVRASFDSLSSDFRLPEHVDFEPSSPHAYHDGDGDGDDSASVASTDSKLAFTPNNRPIHQYTHALGELLSQLDAVESNGDETVRTARKEAVSVVESELERIEDVVERMSVGSAHVQDSDIEEGLQAGDHEKATSQSSDAAVGEVTKNTPCPEAADVTEAISTNTDPSDHFSLLTKVVSPTVDLVTNNSKPVDASLDPTEDHAFPHFEASNGDAPLHATRISSEGGRTTAIDICSLDTMSTQPESASDVRATLASADLINARSVPVSAVTHEEESSATNPVATSLQTMGSTLSGIEPSSPDVARRHQDQQSIPNHSLDSASLVRDFDSETFAPAPNTEEDGMIIVEYIDA